jgi:hypothetical protein
VSSTDALRTEPVTPKGKQTLRNLRRVAKQLYNEVGRDRVTPEMVAEAAYVSIGTAYRYWRDRIAMLDDIAPDRDQTHITVKNPTGEAMCEHGFTTQYLCTTVQELSEENHQLRRSNTQQ